MPTGTTSGRPLVSVVIAAYGRPAQLNLTLTSVRRQTVSDLEILIVADACSQDMLAAIDLQDPRVRLVNLPVRCGHQYGPNSVGLHLARGRYAAFLNHDDLWLDDHLERALATLSLERATFFMARAVFCHRRDQDRWLSELGRLVFAEYNRPDAIWRCIEGPNHLFEPASSWVVDMTLASRIGPWRPPGTVGRTPVMDWICEAARCGARFAFGDMLTVLKLNLHQTTGMAPQYFFADEFLPLTERLLQLGSSELRRVVDSDVRVAADRGLAIRRELVNPPRADDPAERPRIAQYDALCRDGTYPPVRTDAETEVRSWSLQVVAARTGERPVAFPAVQDVLAALQHEHA